MNRKQSPAMLMGVVLALGAAQAAPAGAQELNKPPKGYTALFNGKDLTNWQGLVELPKRSKLDAEQLKAEQAKADEDMRAHWSVKEGILTFDGKGKSLQTAKDYGNFELWVDWRIQSKGDSGIYLRGNPQVQIWAEDAGPALGPDGKFIGSGGLYNNQKNPSKPLLAADNPPTQWNTFWIRMVGDRVTVKLNGKLVVDNTPLENYWERGKPLPARGPIELQNHGNLLEFRNIYLKELPDSPSESAAPGTVTLAVRNVPFGQLVTLLAQTSGADIVLSDPAGKLANRVIGTVILRDRSVETALRLVCEAGRAAWKRDRNGIYPITPAL